MTGLQDYYQPARSDGKFSGSLSRTCLQSNNTKFIDILIGTLLFRISVISSLTGTVMSHDETEVSPLFCDLSSAIRLTQTQAYCNHAFQTFNWEGMMRAVESSDELSQTTIEEQGSIRDRQVALLGQTYRVCPESQKLPLIWMLADIFSPTASGLTPYSSPGVTMVETSNPSLPSPAHSEPARTTDHVVALHRYTSALHERGQRENKKLVRIEEQTITLDPPLFRVTVQYGNITCSGNARTKKEAAHLGAKEICHQLNEAISVV